MTTTLVMEAPHHRFKNTDNVTIELQDLPTVSSTSPHPEDLDEDAYPDGGVRAYLVVLGSFFGLIVNLGLINGIGAIQAYVSLHQMANVSEFSIAWIFSVYLCLAYSFGIFVGPAFDRYGTFSLLVISTALIFLGLMGAALLTEIWHFILSFISMGIGNGVGMTPLIGVINHWFLKKRGYCTGLATSGGSVGGLIFPLMLRSLYENVGFAWALRTLAFFCLGCMGLAMVLVKERIRRSKPTNELSHLEEDEQTKLNKLKNKRKFNLGALKDSRYLFLIAGAFFAELSLVLALTYFASYAIAAGNSESTSYLLLTLWNAVGTFGRWLPGLVSDYYGRFNINILMLLGLNIAFLVMWLPFGHNIALLYAFSIIGGFFLGSVLSMVPSCLSQITKVDEFGERYGTLNFALSIGNLVGIPIGASIINHGKLVEYDRFVVLVGILSLAGTFFWTCSRIKVAGFTIMKKV
ncbi:uncharacterized protein KQ657_000542 [Scheffersomyces spartinae]|uniref:Major facilitator superfamily (MFS) profile domain-containing protein n=1 Tax=Scheffersomyces spartinae TaxID=45513 RepID=A0A9P7V9E8_9ASCO|nr:uncharacterized protein KQ657_000542 [Scheffersomyces spartinae]KAG7193475.1 hypothetical protein KQ657_000542 [Scheffersomyces spartinae]